MATKEKDSVILKRSRDHFEPEIQEKYGGNFDMKCIGTGGAGIIYRISENRVVKVMLGKSDSVKTIRQYQSMLQKIQDKIKRKLSNNYQNFYLESEFEFSEQIKRETKDGKTITYPSFIYEIMEYFQYDLLKYCTKVEWTYKQLIAIFCQIAHGIYLFNSLNILLSDLKLENILINPTNGRIKLIDFYDSYDMNHRIINTYEIPYDIIKNIEISQVDSKIDYNDIYKGIITYAPSSWSRIKGLRILSIHDGHRRLSSCYHLSFSKIQSEIKKIQRLENEKSQNIIIRVGEVTDKTQRYMYTYFDKNAPKKKPEDVWRFGMMLVRFLTVKSNSFRTTSIEDIAHQISKKLRSKVQSIIFNNKTQQFNKYTFDMIESSLSIICNHLRDIWGEVDKDATYERITQLHLLLTKILATNPNDRPLIESVIVHPVFLHMCLIPCPNYSTSFIKSNSNDNKRQDKEYGNTYLNSETYQKQKTTKNKSEKRKERKLKREQRRSQRRSSRHPSRHSSRRLSYDIQKPLTVSEPNISTEQIKTNRNVISEPKEPADNNNMSTSNRWNDIFNEMESSKK
jgi:serine/threonine protein kinase